MRWGRWCAPLLGSAAMWTAACGQSKAPDGEGAAASAAAPAPGGSSPVAAPATGAPSTAPLAGRSGELLNPDDHAVVFLYHDLAGITPSIDVWVENDPRVLYAPFADKPALRTQVRAEMEAGMTAAHGVGRIRLSLNDAQLSDYDPTYGEFTVRALSPASEVTFEAMKEKVAIQFGNGATAQLWKVPAAEAQAMRDRLARQTVSVDAVLVITGVLPGPGGGAIVTDVEEYTLHLGDGTVIARIRPPRTPAS